MLMFMCSTSTVLIPNILLGEICSVFKQLIILIELARVAKFVCFVFLCHFSKILLLSFLSAWHNNFS